MKRYIPRKTSFSGACTPLRQARFIWLVTQHFLFNDLNFFLDLLIFFYFLLEKFFRDLIRDQIRDQSLDLIRGPIRGPVRYLVQSGPVRSYFSRPVSLLFPVFRKSAAAARKCENIVCSEE